MKIEDLIKVTKHAKPRRMLRRIGYTLEAWVEDGWDTFHGTDAEWEAAKANHIRLFQHITLYAKQPNTVDNLTEAQRVAYNTFAGNMELGVVDAEGKIGALYSVHREGDNIRQKDLDALQAAGWFVIPVVTNHYTGVATDIAQEYHIPETYLHPSQTPIDPWVKIYETSLRNDYEDVQSFLDEYVGDNGNTMMAEMAIYHICFLEDSLQQAEEGDTLASLEFIQGLLEPLYQRVKDLGLWDQYQQKSEYHKSRKLVVE